MKRQGRRVNRSGKGRGINRADEGVSRARHGNNKTDF